MPSYDGLIDYYKKYLNYSDENIEDMFREYSASDKESEVSKGYIDPGNSIHDMFIKNALFERGYDPGLIQESINNLGYLNYDHNGNILASFPYNYADDFKTLNPLEEYASGYGKFNDLEIPDTVYSRDALYNIANGKYGEQGIEDLINMSANDYEKMDTLYLLADLSKDEDILRKINSLIYGRYPN